MITITFDEIVTPDMGFSAIINNEFPGFRKDYLVIHCLLRKHNPKTIFEIGTNMGRGTEIICNAVPNAKVFSLDLPTEDAHISLQHPISEGKGDKVGSLCKFPFTQLRGNSMTFDFGKYPCEAYYIDGEHTYKNVLHETKAVLKCKPKLVIYHDSDIEEVMNGIIDGVGKKKYSITMVEETRITYLTKL